jgi:hypothetical protein
MWVFRRVMIDGVRPEYAPDWLLVAGDVAELLAAFN